MQCKVAGELAHTFVNGPGIRYTVFFQGCTHVCPGCHNPETHDINAGQTVDTDEIIARIRAAKFLDGVTLSGGDPFLQPEACAEIAREAKAIGLSVWAYSGWMFEELLRDEARRKALHHIDVLVDGPFIEAQKVGQADTCLWRGSANQRLVNVQASLSTERAILFNK